MANDEKKKKPTTATTDPLEAAKIASKPPPPPPPPPAPEPELHLPTGEVEAPKPAVKRYKVAVTTTVSLDGQLVKLTQGDTVSEAEYGPRGVAQIKGANVALVEVE